VTGTDDTDGLLGRVLDDRALLLSVCERLAPSMSGFPAWRLVRALEDVQRGGFPFDAVNRVWLTEGLRAAAKRDRLRRWRDEVAKLADDGVRVVACFDAGYPANLRKVHNRPPVLFVRGSIRSSDVRAVAVAGARSASVRGLRLAADIASGLAACGVTVVSGLAEGVDTAAHTAAVDAGGRTIAVFGTPIGDVYPASNRSLADAVARSGACVSQFLPNGPTGRWCFPVRNVTASGLSLGTVVVEAQPRSGARHQAEAALDHGRRVFLAEGLATRPRWAARMVQAQYSQVSVASDAQTIISLLDDGPPPADGKLF